MRIQILENPWRFRIFYEQMEPYIYMTDDNKSECY